MGLGKRGLCIHVCAFLVGSRGVATRQGGLRNKMLLDRGIGVMVEKWCHTRAWVYHTSAGTSARWQRPCRKAGADEYVLCRYEAWHSTLDHSCR